MSHHVLFRDAKTLRDTMLLYARARSLSMGAEDVGKLTNDSKYNHPSHNIIELMNFRSKLMILRQLVKTYQNAENGVRG